MKGGAGGACLILHGGFLIVVFLYMIPVSIYLIRHRYGHHHACINLIAFGAVILAIFVKKFSTTTAVRATTESYWTSPFGISHGTIGWSLFSALFSQLIIGLLRPRRESCETRKMWFFNHSLLGYATVTLSVIALLTGCSAAMEHGYLLPILEVFVPIVVLSYICTYYLYHGNPNRRSIATSIAGASIEDGREREEIEVECAEVDTLNAAYVHCDYTLLQ